MREVICKTCGSVVSAPAQADGLATVVSGSGSCPDCAAEAACGEPPSLRQLAHVGPQAAFAAPRGAADDEVMSLTGDLFANRLMRSPLMSLAPSAFDIDPSALLLPPAIAAPLAPSEWRIGHGGRRRWASVLALAAAVGALGLVVGRAQSKPSQADASSEASPVATVLPARVLPVVAPAWKSVAATRIEPYVPVVVAEPVVDTSAAAEAPAPVELPAAPSAAEPRPSPMIAAAAIPEPVNAAPQEQPATTARSEKAEPEKAQPQKAEPAKAEPEKAQPAKAELALKGAAREGNAEAQDTTAVEAPEPTPELGPFDRTSAAAALSKAAASASECRVGEGDHGQTRVSVTFAPSGRVTTAVLGEGSIFLGTPIAGCIVSRMRGAEVAPFTGDKVTVHATVTID